MRTAVGTFDIILKINKMHYVHTVLGKKIIKNLYWQCNLVITESRLFPLGRLTKKGKTQKSKGAPEDFCITKNIQYPYFI